MFIPQFFRSLREYSLQALQQDFFAGFTVACLSIPLALAIAIASGGTPLQGLTTAIIGGLVVALLGGSRFQVAGPTGAFVVVVYQIIQTYGLEGLWISMFLAGIFLILAGLLRIGKLIYLIPGTVISGFTAGIALVLMSAQISNIFGFAVPAASSFSQNLQLLWEHGTTAQITPLLISLATLGGVIALPRYMPKLPSFAFMILILTSITMFFNLPVVTIGQRFGNIIQTLPTFVWPELTLMTLSTHIVPAFTIAILAGIEALLAAIIADRLSQKPKHQPNTELMAHGLANILTATFGGLPVTGAIARTSANIRAGAISPLSGVFQALMIIVIVACLAPWLAAVPLCVLAALTAFVAWRILEWEHLVVIFKKGQATDILVFGATFILTLWSDLTIAITVGCLIAGACSLLQSFRAKAHSLR